MDFIDKNKPFPVIDKREKSNGNVFVSMVMNPNKYYDVEDIRASIIKAIESTGNIPYFIDNCT